MLVLLETPVGFALLKVLDEGKLSKLEDIRKKFSSADSARQVVELKAFSKFDNIEEALSAATCLIESNDGLRKFLCAHCEGETLAVADSQLGNAIKEKLHIECIHNKSVMELMLGIKSQLTELLSGCAVQHLALMNFLSRYKLESSSEKDDTMIIQAISLLDGLNKELDAYAMRVHEQYECHFPELTEIVQDNTLYVEAVKLVGNRANAANLDLSKILPEEVETKLKEAAVISMGTEVAELDLINIRRLCDQFLSFFEYRAQLYVYLKRRMNTIAPNLTALVGELVGARLIACTGSLLDLAKQPAGTVQILGAGRAFFKALKTNHATPKHGLIYQASLIEEAAPKLKGKLSRSLAAKIALCVRCDAFGEKQDDSLGLECRAELEAWVRTLEGRELGVSAGSAKGKPKKVYYKERPKGAGALITATETYNPAAESALAQVALGDEEDICVKKTATEEPLSSLDKGEKKKKKKKTQEGNVTGSSEKKKKERKEDEGSEKHSKKKGKK